MLLIEYSIFSCLPVVYESLFKNSLVTFIYTIFVIHFLVVKNITVVRHASQNYTDANHEKSPMQGHIEKLYCS